MPYPKSRSKRVYGMLKKDAEKTVAKKIAKASLKPVFIADFFVSLCQKILPATPKGNSHESELRRVDKHMDKKGSDILCGKKEKTYESITRAIIRRTQIYIGDNFL